MEALLEKLSAMIASAPYLAPVAAFVSGILTSFMPCSLSTIPLVIGYVGSATDDDASEPDEFISDDETGRRKSKRKSRAFVLSLLFALGSTIVFCALGLFASAIGSLLESSERIMHILMGILLILMALQMWSVIDIVPSGSSLLAKNRRKGALGALFAGLLAGLFASHCALPVVIALMAVAAEAGSSASDPFMKSTAFGAILLLIFSIGHAILSVVAGTSIGFVQRLMNSKRYERASKIIRIVLGIIIMLIAIWLLAEAIIGE